MFKGMASRLAAVAPPITATSQARLKVNDVQGRGVQCPAGAPAIFTTSQARRAPGLRCNVQARAADPRHEPGPLESERCSRHGVQRGRCAADHRHKPGAPRARMNDATSRRRCAADLHHEPGPPRARTRVQRPGRAPPIFKK